MLYLQNKGFRYVEALVVALIVAIAASFAIEIWWATPNLADVASGFLPTRPEIVTNPEMLYIAIGILGATVMPHNLYLHSSIVQTRRYLDTLASKTRSDSLRDDRLVGRAHVGAVHQRGDPDRVRGDVPRHGYETVADIGDAYQLLSPLLGAAAASTLFAVALLCSGQNATLTGTLAGQIVMEGFVNIRLRPWLRRLITRLVAIVPAVIVVICMASAGRRAPRAQPGDSEPAAAVRGVSARELHRRPAQDGRSS